MARKTSDAFPERSVSSFEVTWPSRETRPNWDLFAYASEDALTSSRAWMVAVIVPKGLTVESRLDNECAFAREPERLSRAALIPREVMPVLSAGVREAVSNVTLSLH